MNKATFLFILFSAIIAQSFGQKNFELRSPDGKVRAQINKNKEINYSIFHENDILLKNASTSLTLLDGKIIGQRIVSSKTKTVNTTIATPNYKKAEVIDHYNELNIQFADGFSLIFRAYNDGVAYRYVYGGKSDFTIKNELVNFNFTANNKAYVAYVDDRNGAKDSFEKQFFNSHENTYQYKNISNFIPTRLAMTPLVIECTNNKKVCLVESDLINYPGMYLANTDGSNSLKAIFPAYPSKLEMGGHNMLQEIVTQRENFIAKGNAQSILPWRGLIIAANDIELANSDFVYKLATPSKITDVSWIKPGKVAWDWWNDWNLYGVDFKSGVNNETYKYYIDFASKFGVEYVILDEGWAVNLKSDMFQVVPEINLEMLVAYAKERKVDLILWAGFNAFNADIERVCRHYSAMGIKGFKVDFMDRDDQPMVEFHYRAAAIAAKYNMLLNYHGTYKPTGLQRTYPNVINFEAVHGLEQMKWSPATVDQVSYDVTLPFVRQVAGPIDYTQGAMRNATRSNYQPINNEPMSQGTRCRQLAQYIVFESPLNMLCDNPSNYMAEPEITQFIAAVPTVWDETRILKGKIAEYICTARRSKNTWYIGALTNWDQRLLTLDLTFLGEGEFQAEIFRDGINANRVARDYKREIVSIPQNRSISIQMAQGGGFAMKITKMK